MSVNQNREQGPAKSRVTSNHVGKKEQMNPKKEKNIALELVREHEKAMAKRIKRVRKHINDMNRQVLDNLHFKYDSPSKK